VIGLPGKVHAPAGDISTDIPEEPITMMISPEYQLIQAIMKDRIRYAEQRRVVAAARAARPPRSARSKSRTGARRLARPKVA
jgi:hypothetical protein